jgi:hypothetical protein
VRKSENDTATCIETCGHMFIPFDFDASFDSRLAEARKAKTFDPVVRVSSKHVVDELLDLCR